jgi:hypothetical protein
MDKLGERNAYMISHAMKSVGYDAEDIIAYTIEDMFANEVIELCKFIRWICKERIPCTEHTMEEVFEGFKADEEVGDILNEKDPEKGIFGENQCNNTYS